MRSVLLLLLTGCIQESAVSVTLSGEGGLVTSNPAGISCGPEDESCAMLVEPGTLIELIAIETTPYDRFIEWSGGCTGNGACTLELNSDVHVDAFFQIFQHLLLVEVVGAGSVSAAPGGLTCNSSSGTCGLKYLPGTRITLSARPETAGVAFVNWTGVDGCTTDPVCTFTIDRHVTARATFAPPP